MGDYAMEEKETALSDELKNMLSMLDAMSFILDSISKSLSEGGWPAPGSDTMQSVLEWQAGFNRQIQRLQDVVSMKLEEETEVDSSVEAPPAFASSEIENKKED